MDELHGTRSQVTVATVDRQLPEHGVEELQDIAQVKDWLASIKNSREISVNVTNIAKRTVSPSVTFLTNIQTITNDAIFGFFEKGFDNTHDFLTAYGMDAKLGAAACMTETQLHYRKMLAKLVWTFINTTPRATREDVIQYTESKAVMIYDDCVRWDVNKLFKPVDNNCKSLLTYAEERVRSLMNPTHIAATKTDERKRILGVNPDNEILDADQRVRKAQRCCLRE
ncbi:hypothetical protein CYMTET_18585 [Cymbomonas tetramitiformis]|uniref:Uncharacterized protein n=1 Tax=Cymbomonas tetramitiformis TaxID=36881 RepID=A0AAE0G852_9CHLO|nr:hypothetical protein CYMTET_18585 [Cymbomonas tetramitiformis]